MKSKKIIALVLAAITALICVAFAGCSGDQNKDSYIIYSDNSFAPFEYLDEETQQYVGIDMDILAAIAEDQGFKYEVKNEGFDPSLGAVQSGQADGMIAGMTINDERKETFDFSDSYFVAGQLIAVASNSSIDSLEGLRGQSVAVKISTMGAKYAESIKDEYNLTLHYYEASEQMYQAVSAGTDVACFEDNAVIAYAISTGAVDLKTVGDTVNAADYGFAVKKGQNAELIEMFNKGLENIKANGKYDEILAKYGM